MAFESGVVPVNQRSVVIVSLYKAKGERTEYKNYKGISLLNVVGKNIWRDLSRQSQKIYTGILVDRVLTVTGGLIDDEQGGFRAGQGCVDQIYTLKQICDKV